MERARGWIWLGLTAAWALGCQAEACGENIDSPLSLFPAAELSWGQG